MKTKKFDVVLPGTHFLSKMEHFGVLKAGETVTKELLENILGEKYVSPDDWRFLGKYLALKTSIEAAGYFVTQAELEAPAFRILRSDEMALHAERKMAKSMSTMFRVAMVMANHDISDLEEREKKVFNHVKQKAAMAALATQKIVLADVFFD